MTEIVTGILAGIIVSLINKFIVNGNFWNHCQQPTGEEEDDDGLSSQSSAIISDIHIH
jgi:hypothetical protein